MSEELTLRGAKAWIPHQLPPRTGGIVITLKPCPCMQRFGIHRVQIGDNLCRHSRNVARLL